MFGGSLDETPVAVTTSARIRHFTARLHSTRVRASSDLDPSRDRVLSRGNPLLFGVEHSKLVVEDYRILANIDPYLQLLR